MDSIHSSDSLPPIPRVDDASSLFTYLSRIIPIYYKLELELGHANLQRDALSAKVSALKQVTEAAKSGFEDANHRLEFLERYSANLVRERNQLLHGKSADDEHFVRHSCCRRKDSKIADVETIPSIISLRGKELDKCKSELETMRRLLEAKDNELRESQNRLADSVAERDIHRTGVLKHMKNLEMHIKKISIQKSSLENKYEETVKTKEDLQSLLKSAEGERDAALGSLENQKSMYESLRESKETLEGSYNDLMYQINHMKKKEKNLVDKLSQSNLELLSANATIDTLKAEISMLQNQETKDIISRYNAKLDEYRQQLEEKETKLSSYMSKSAMCEETQDAKTNEEEKDHSQVDFRIKNSDRENSSPVVWRDLFDYPDASMEESLCSISAEWKENRVSQSSPHMSSLNSNEDTHIHVIDKSFQHELEEILESATRRRVEEEVKATHDLKLLEQEKRNSSH